MAIAFTGKGSDRQTTSGTTVTLSSVSVASGAMLVVCVGNMNTAATISSVTWNSTNLASAVDLLNSGYARAAIYYLADCPAATSDVVVTWSASNGTRFAAALQVTDVGELDQTGETSVGNVTNPSVSTSSATTTADEALVAILSSVPDSISSWTGDASTQQYNSTEFGVATGVATSTGTKTSACTTSRGRGAFVIATFEAGSIAPSYVGAGVAGATCGAVNATVSPGSVSVAAGVAAASGTAGAGGVSPGAVSMAAGVASASGTAVAATADPGTGPTLTLSTLGGTASVETLAAE